MARLDGTLWEGVALRRTRIGADPDAPPRALALPANWEEEAAAALAALAPGAGPANLPRAAESWIARALARGEKSGLLGPKEAAHLAEGWRALLLSRRGSPGAETWRGDARAEPRFVLNLPAFLEPDGAFDLEGYAEACALGVMFLEAVTGGKSARLRLGFADLAGLLAMLDLVYDSTEARQVAAGIAALTRGAAESQSGRLAARLGAREPVALIWPTPPASTPLPGLAAAARAALDSAAAAPGLRHIGLVALAPADATEALLGAETAGIAPAPGATRTVETEAGIVDVPTRAALRAPQARVPALLGPVSERARTAMMAVVSPFLHAAPPAPVAAPAAPRPAPAPRPALRRQAGQTLHVSVGGHKVALRTAEEDGALREIAFSLSKEGANYRSLMDAFAQAVSTGLARGVPLADYVDAFAYTRFGPAGLVEGDPDIPRATSVLDWAFRRLAIDYLGGALPQPEAEDVAPDSAARAIEQSPLLPLDLPAVAPKGRHLRIVA
ncbi:TSCPD domain-containing protein [Roseococcus pinisoli]|uniref:ribonucleoside-diphosphate reductase n=1 Tax=Roseococcus pinisoli TaxID=2835040 RepID=A0ABS5QBC1_9PROT|nr:TSCPD domain-containing protein [Roseococcus pinisoli]MBS7810994.1 TSCPD domain-containing protein [Roseococcus pinisoli]